MKKLIWVLASLVLAGVLMCGVASAASSGTDGNITWTLSDDGVLTISGSGAMPNYNGTEPWASRSPHVTSIVISEGVTSISDNAFNFFSNLENAMIADSVTSIGRCAFMNCYRLETVSMPKNTAIGQYAFRGCNGLADEQGLIIIDGVLHEYTGAKSVVVVPDNVTAIRDGAFSNRSQLTVITIGSNVTSIGDSCFYDCTKLQRIVIADSVTSIGSEAFNGCTNLKSVAFGTGVIDIGEGAFMWCSSLISITFPDSVTSIGNSAFQGCTSLESITISRNVTSIGGNTFDNCTDLTNVTIPNSVINIGPAAFWGCSGLTNITIPDSVISIGDDAFVGCTGLTSVTIPDSVTSIGDGAFNGCTGLTSITIPDSVTVVGSAAFCGCDSLTDITVSAGNNSFSTRDGVLFNKDQTVLIAYPCGKESNTYCIPDGITLIADGAFAKCEKLSNIIVPQSVIGIGHDAFSYCSKLASIQLPDNLVSIDGFVFYGSGLASIVIPDNVGSIGPQAFSNCSNLTVVIIPESTTDIANNAFVWSNKLKCITVSKCGCYAQEWAKSQGFSTIALEHRQLVIDRATVTCTQYGLTEGSHCEACGAVVEQQMAAAALGHDWGHDVTYTWSEDYSTLTAFRVCTRDATHIDSESVSVSRMVIQTPSDTNPGAYGFVSAVFTNEAFTAQRADGGTIPALNTLTSPTFPANLTTIEDEAFAGTPFQAIIIPDTVTAIGSRAFANCRNLVYAYIPASVTSIADDVFADCPNVIIDSNSH